MAIKALIFDMDGTLVDTNDAHALAWQQSFAEQGFEVALERINEEIGKGGDHLVESILGAQKDKEFGDELRQGHTRHFLEMIKAEPVRAFEGAQELIEHAHASGLKTALATSSKEDELEAVEKSSGVAWRELFDVVVTGSDVDASKPSPDNVTSALQKLELQPSQCLFVGDTIYDARASKQAGVGMIGVLTGPFSASQLREAGAQQTYGGISDLLKQFQHAIDSRPISAPSS